MKILKSFDVQKISKAINFSAVDKTDVEKSVGNLNSSKVETFKNIPTN